MIDLWVDGLRSCRQQSCSTPRAITESIAVIPPRRLAFRMFRRICCGDPSISYRIREFQ